ncbi:class I SAM-dependent methyltransferase [Planctomycetota bacterium]
MLSTGNRLCRLCDKPGTLESASEVVEVNSNVRQFAGERFTVWRCDNCFSLCSGDVPDLDHYYQQYPFKLQKPNLGWRLITQNYIRRLKKVGLRRGHTLLDYGCGSGLLVAELRRRGYHRVIGYDAYNEKYIDRDALGRQYDFVVLQDVIEHDENPAYLLDEVIKLTVPGGIVCIGSPNAEAIDLRRPQSYLHSLHQPYHRNILSAQILRSLARNRGLTVLRFYNIYYADSFRPFANVRFRHYYARLFDNTLDLAFEKHMLTWRLLKPKALALAFLGRLRPNRAEMMFIFRKPARQLPKVPGKEACKIGNEC